MGGSSMKNTKAHATSAELPPLPRASFYESFVTPEDTPLFTEDQMHVYALAAIAASAPTGQGAGLTEAGPLCDGWQASYSADGHSGPGVYAHMTEYPEEGAVLICEVPATRSAGDGQAVAKMVSRPGFELLTIQWMVDTKTIPDGALLYLAPPPAASVRKQGDAALLDWMDANQATIDAERKGGKANG
jgi:hypothetical protein